MPVIFVTSQNLLSFVDIFVNVFIQTLYCIYLNDHNKVMLDSSKEADRWWKLVYAYNDIFP